MLAVGGGVRVVMRQREDDKRRLEGRTAALGVRKAAVIHNAQQHLLHLRVRGRAGKACVCGCEVVHTKHVCVWVGVCAMLLQHLLHARMGIRPPSAAKLGAREGKQRLYVQMRSACVGFVCLHANARCQ